MTRLEEIKKYAENCLNDKKHNCKKHRWACQRLLRDLERVDTPSFPYVWSEEDAEAIVKWFSYLRHSKGVLAGQPIELTEWQKFRLCQLYGWRHKETGRRRFKKYFIEVGRKNAKSQELAGVSLYEMSVTASKNKEVNEVYTAGVKRQQSKIVSSEAALMLHGSPLRKKFKVNRDGVRHLKSESFIQPLSKDDKKSGDGTNPALLVIDEYHQHPTTEFYDLSLGSNTKEPLLMIITTAGVNLNYPCYKQEYKYCSKVLDPDVNVENDEYLIDICELDEEDYADLRNLEDIELWKKANPIRMSYPEGIEKIKGDYELAKQIPEKMTAFLTKCMNIWVQSKENGYMDMAKWNKCRVDKEPINTRGMEVYVGFDMSAKIDLTSVSFIIPYLSDEVGSDFKPIVKYIVYSHSFIPNREKLAERIATDRVPYDAWERMKLLTITDTPIVDQTAVINYVLGFCSSHGWKINTLCFDPANASKLMMDLSEQGYIVEEVYQSQRSLNEATQGFREQVYSGNVYVIENPLLDYAMSNAVIRSTSGLIKIDKDAGTQRIDPVDATLCAFKLALYHDFGISYSEYIDEFLERDDW